MGDELTVALVEEAEAFFGLLVFAGLGADATVPTVGDDVAHELEVYAVAFENFGIALLELVLDIAGTHLVETEVLQNVAEKVVRNGELTLLQVMVEALLEVSGHLGWQVANVGLLRGLRAVLLLLLLIVLFDL